MRFNPPPNWPPAPPGWEPDANWVPDPSWPAPPPGWQLWVDDQLMPEYPLAPGEAPQFGPGHPQQGYPQHEYAGGPAGWPPPGRTTSRTWLWLSLGSLVVVALVAVAVLAGLARPGADRPSEKPDITELASGLLVDRSAFPEISGGKWISGVNTAEPDSAMPNLKFDPPECADLYGDSKSATQTATATLANFAPGGLHSMKMHLAITGEQRDLKGYLEKCRTFTQTVDSGKRSVTTEITLDPLEAADVPPWAVATVMTSSSTAALRLPMAVTAATVAGYYRGVLVVASSNDIRLRTKKDNPAERDNTAALVKLFNAQIEKLEAAP